MAFRILGGAGKSKRGRWMQPPLMQSMSAVRRDPPKKLKQGKQSFNLLGFNTPTSILRLGYRGSQAKLTRARKKAS